MALKVVGGRAACPFVISVSDYLLDNLSEYLLCYQQMNKMVFSYLWSRENICLWNENNIGYGWSALDHSLSEKPFSIYIHASYETVTLKFPLD